MIKDDFALNLLIADPRILAVRIYDNNEPLIDLCSQTVIAYGLSPEIPDNTDYTKVRKTIYEKLVAAQKLLLKHLRFCLYEGYLSLSLQKLLFNNHFSAIKKSHPQWSYEQIFIETTKLVSPVHNMNGSKNIPPHSTGGAIDVYLIDEFDNIVDMGLPVKDWATDIDGTLSATASLIISDEAKDHRAIMKESLSAVRSINYFAEYWHWSYGDRYWAYNTDAACALYGTVDQKNC